ncbi:DUF6882 domain-containing protein [Streptomyces sp. NPDC002773]|uniref:DUF6882 domain-containing protein n=1 Tax=Streptomyces sp. NPDC002773 TaxID=3154430 RepID=UPI0033265F3C
MTPFRRPSCGARGRSAGARTFPDRTAAAPAQILASSSPGAGSWLWAWANESILPDMSRDARGVRHLVPAGKPGPQALQ